MALNFPDSPTLNQAYSAGGKTWTFNGSRWVVLSAAAQPISALNDIQDVTITSVSSGQVVQWNGTAWVNATVSSDVMTDTRNAALILMDIGA